MADEYIKRRDVYQFAKDQLIKETGAYTKGCNKAFHVMMSAAKNKEAIPSADVAPVVRCKDCYHSMPHTNTDYIDCPVFCIALPNNFYCKFANTGGRKMTDYTELIKRLRSHNGWALNQTLDEAADAVEELSKERDFWKSTSKEEREAYLHWFENYQKDVPKWIPIKSRPMDENERQHYSEHIGYDLTDDEAVIYCCELPDDGEEVLTCNRYGYVRMDTFSTDPADGCYFEDNGEMDGIVAWMRKPKPYEPPKEG